MNNWSSPHTVDRETGLTPLSAVLTRANGDEMNKYWNEQRGAVQDGGNLRSDQAAALFDWIADMERIARFLINEPTELHRWFDLKTVLDSGPKIPED